MKNNYFFLLFLIICFSSFGQEKDPVILPLVINENIILKKNTRYLFKDKILLNKDVTLTIQEGVVLISDSDKNPTFMVESGAKIIACGSYDDPIKAIGHKLSQEELKIVIKSASSENSKIASSLDFTYQKIENPTILMNNTLSKTESFATVTTDF